jgi:signal transduction histidine kinase/FixJ family two-component response regulator/HPt (histidine-containing phosphotransfer) domain-containing protein
MKERAGPFFERYRDILVVVLLLAAGSLFGWWRVVHAEQDMRDDLARRARMLAESVNTSRFRELSGSRDDLQSPVYLRFKDHFKALIAAFSDYRFIYLVGRRPDGTVFFYVDSESAGSPEESLPGDVYAEVDPAFLAVFDEKRERVVGPVSDRWGIWVSAWIPVLEPKSGKVSFVFAVDADGRKWRLEARRAAFLPNAAALLLALVFIAGRVLFSRRGVRQDQDRRRWCYRHAETLFVAAVGLILTCSAVLIASDSERRAMEKSFHLLAASELKEMNDGLHSIRDVGIEGLGSFFEYSDFVDPSEFVGFTRHLVHLPHVRGITWIPAVPLEERKEFEENARRLLHPDFFIWEPDGAERSPSAFDRSVYYPVLYRVPAEGNERLIGRDFSRDTVRKNTMDQAALALLPAATEPLPLISGQGDLKGIVVFRPVLSQHQERRLLGFVGIVVELDFFINRIRVGGGFDSVLNGELWYLTTNGEHHLVIATGNVQQRTPAPAKLMARQNTFFAAAPLFLFGRTFLAVLRPAPDFFSLHHRHSWWITALSGILITGLLILISVFVVRRREDLEDMVLKRTEELLRSKDELASINTSLLETTRRAQEMARRAEIASGAKGRFLANMSHEMRTPMNGFLGMIALLRDTPLTGEQSGYLLSAQRCGEAMLSMISDALDIAAIDERRFQILEEEFDLRALLEGIETVYGASARGKGLRFTLALPPEVPLSLFGDGARLYRLLRNLADNAVKFTDKGEIALSVSKAEENGENVRLLFSMADTGIGISAEAQRNVFERFWQRDDSSTKRHQGAGLGLAMVRELVTLLGGRIDLRSEEGKGTEFLVSIPFRKAPPADSARTDNTAAMSAGKTGRKRILVAEDNAINRKFALALLDKLGYAASAAVDGREALEFLARNECDLVLMDVQMPVMDGVEATRAIRSGQGGVLDPSVPIVALTAYASPDDRERCMNAGMNGFLAKPATPDSLYAVLQRLLFENKERNKTMPVAPLLRAAPDVFDRKGALKRLMDDEDALKELAAEFLEDIGPEFDALAGLVAFGDAEGAGRQAHSIKGAAAGMGGEALRTVAFEMEKAGKASDLDSLRSLLPELEKQHDLLRKELTGMLSENSWEGTP